MTDLLWTLGPTVEIKLLQGLITSNHTFARVADVEKFTIINSSLTFTTCFDNFRYVSNADSFLVSRNFLDAQRLLINEMFILVTDEGRM